MFDSAQGLADSISINDFSTLYTLFDHEHLLGNMNWLLSKLSRNSGMSFLRVGHGTAWWVADDTEGVVYSVAEIVEMIEYLIRNTYVKAFGKIFCQDRGIIMGGIYPPSLELTQENSSNSMANVLDMEVKLVNGNITTKVYCKTDTFPFNVISLPFLETNIDTKICYKVFYGQIIRFQRLCTDISTFEERTKILIDILIKRRYRFDKLQREFCRAIERFISDFQVWSIPLDFKDWFLNISRGLISTN